MQPKPKFKWRNLYIKIKGLALAIALFGSNPAAADMDGMLKLLSYAAGVSLDSFTQEDYTKMFGLSLVLTLNTTGSVSDTAIISIINMQFDIWKEAHYSLPAVTPAEMVVLAPLIREIVGVKWWASYFRVQAFSSIPEVNLLQSWANNINVIIAQQGTTILDNQLATIELSCAGGI